MSSSSRESGESECESDFFSSGEEEDEFSNDNDDNSEDDEYDPDGVESDEDNGGCCQWKTTTTNTEYESFEPSTNLSENGKPSISFEENILPNELVEKVLDDDFINKCIECTDSHGINEFI